MSARIAYLLKKFPRLSETFILNELLAQEAHGRELHVFSRRTPDDEPRHPQLASLQAPTENLPDKRELDPWEILFLRDDLPEELFARVGRLVRTARTWNHPRFPSLLTEALWLYGRTREMGVRHLHTHFATDSAVTALLLKELGGPSYSITAHAKDIYRETVDPTMLDRLVAGAEFVVTVCDANVEWMHGLISQSSRPRVRRLYNGIDLENFSVPSTPRKENHVLAVGRLVEKKGFHVLFEAVRRLRADVPDLQVTVIGEGDQRERLEALRDELGLGDVVHLAGALDQGEVRRHMAEASLMCLPCLIGDDGNRDALPTVLLEALAVGLPCVSTPVTGIPEILDQGRVGLLVPENDAAATARAMAELLGDPARRAEMARAGRVRAEELFDRKKTSAILHGWFDEVLAGKVGCASPA